ncbi:MAG TPA: peptide-methionine (S)-S-oxide reductase MsrA, partial [Thermoleophilaceae bacterium]|nr:peptide-methionine (S)-S-oxide reductase MsrA [Thermoleophilaceae bacterium]
EEETMEKAVFAAGCFGRVEEPFHTVPGVLGTQVGYTGGHVPDPSYEDVCTGTTGHAEALEVEFDPESVSYPDLLEVFWKIHDPTRLDRRRPDVGTQYPSAIFVHSPEQEAAAHASMARAQTRFSKPIVTEIEPASEFYRAEESHQRYVDTRRSVGFAR